MCREGVLRKVWGGKSAHVPARCTGFCHQCFGGGGMRKVDVRLAVVACFKWNSRSGNFAVEQLYSAELVRNRFQKECQMLSSSSPRNCGSATSALHF